MTMALCMLCGELKVGAFTECPVCRQEPFGSDLAIMLSDHNLLESELHQIGVAIKIISTLNLDNDTYILLLLYYLGRNWPKVLSFKTEELDSDSQQRIRRFYDKHLSKCPKQNTPTLQVSSVTKRRWQWSSSLSSTYNEADLSWQSEVPAILKEGISICDSILKTNIEAGEGALLERLVFGIKHVFNHFDYSTLESNVMLSIKEAKEYELAVNEFCSHIKNGWSERTKHHAGFLRGIAKRLCEMAELSQKLIQHKSGSVRKIKLEIIRIRQLHNRSYSTILYLFKIAANPHLITPELMNEYDRIDLERS